MNVSRQHRNGGRLQIGTLAGFKSVSPTGFRRNLQPMRAGLALFEEQSKFLLFLARSGEGHLIEYRENRKLLPKWSNHLRHSYPTLAQAAGLSEIDFHLMMNHSLPGVNAGYITRGRLPNNHPYEWEEMRG